MKTSNYTSWAGNTSFAKKGQHPSTHRGKEDIPQQLKKTLWTSGTRQFEDMTKKEA
jgi:hypothetical protein